MNKAVKQRRGLSREMKQSLRRRIALWHEKVRDQKEKKMMKRSQLLSKDSIGSKIISRVEQKFVDSEFAADSEGRIKQNPSERTPMKERLHGMMISKIDGVKTGRFLRSNENISVEKGVETSKSMKIISRMRPEKIIESELQDHTKILTDSNKPNSTSLSSLEDCITPEDYATYFQSLRSNKEYLKMIESANSLLKELKQKQIELDPKGVENLVSLTMLTIADQINEVDSNLDDELVSQNVADAQFLFKTLLEMHLVPWTKFPIHILLLIYSKTGRFPDAMNLLDDVVKLYKHLEIDVLMFRFVIKAAFDAKDMRAVDTLYKRALSELKSLDFALFTEVVRGYGSVGAVRLAMKTFNFGLEKGLKPGASDFHVLIHACTQLSSAKYFDYALGFFAKMRQSSINPAISTYFSLLKCSSSLGKFRQTTMILEEMGELADANAYYHFFKAISNSINIPNYEYDHDRVLTKSQRAVLALDYYTSLRKENIEFNHTCLNSLLSVLIQGHGSNILPAISFFRQIPENGLKPDILSWKILVKGLSEISQESTLLQATHSLFLFDNLELDKETCKALCHSANNRKNPVKARWKKVINLLDQSYKYSWQRIEEKRRKFAN